MAAGIAELLRPDNILKQQNLGTKLQKSRATCSKTQNFGSGQRLMIATRDPSASWSSNRSQEKRALSLALASPVARDALYLLRRGTDTCPR